MRQTEHSKTCKAFFIECIKNSEKAGKNISMKAAPENKREKTRFEIAILPELLEFIRQESAESGKPMYIIANELIAQAVALRQGETLIQQQMPMFSELLEDVLRMSDRRVITQMTRYMRENCKREADVAHHMIYLLAEKLVSPEFAAKSFEEAKEKAEKEIASRQNKEHKNSSTRESA
jgi:hypothetical protein